MGTTKKKSDSVLERLTGILLPREWDADGNIIALSLMTAGEKEYAVHVQQLASLFPFVRQEIDADCEIHHADPFSQITILSCRPTQATLS